MSARPASATPAFLRSELLRAHGVDHGLGTRASAEAATDVARLSLVKQVHGVDFATVPGAGPATRADGVWTGVVGRAVGVYTADCVPVLLVAPQARGVAAVHAGWRGSAARIVERGVVLLCDRFGARPGDLLAVIGPCIGACCYEVDAPVRDAFASHEAFRPAARADRWMLDLRAETRAQLEGAGVASASIEDVGDCTACDRDTYASYRRDGGGERMLHWVRAGV